MIGTEGVEANPRVQHGGDTLTSDALAELKFEPTTPLRRAMFIFVGTGALGLGILGAYLPGMPSTVFFLIAIGAYARSSERMYRWMLTRTWLQGPLRTALAYRRHKAVPVRIKIFAQSVAWSSALFLIFSGRTLIAQWMGIALALSCSVAMAVLRTMPDGRALRRWKNTRRDMWLQLGFGAAAGGIAAAIWMIAAAGVQRFAANLGVAPAFDPANLPSMAASAVPFAMAAGVAYAALRGVLPRNQWLRGAAFGLGCAALAALFERALGQSASEGAWQLRALVAVTIVAAGLAATLVFGQLERQAVTDAAPRGGAG